MEEKKTKRPRKEERTETKLNVLRARFSTSAQDSTLIHLRSVHVVSVLRVRFPPSPFIPLIATTIAMIVTNHPLPSLNPHRYSCRVLVFSRSRILVFSRVLIFCWSLVIGTRARGPL